MKPGNLCVSKRCQIRRCKSEDKESSVLCPPAPGEYFFGQKAKEIKKMGHYLFTSESVTEGHPDKICDQISDAILDAILAKDSQCHVACECAATTGMVFVMGEITTTCYVDIPKIAREVLRDIGYDRAKYGMDCDTCAVVTSIDEQSPDIAMGVNESLEHKSGGSAAELENGAGDQGMMFGYACDETPEMMPLPISLAHRLAHRLAQVRKDGTLPYLRPDGKVQVTIEYDENDRPVRVDTVVVSTQHAPDIEQEQIREDIIREVITPVLPERLNHGDIKYFVNPTGRFVVGGPQGDSGLTGRKIIVDTYGGSAPHGGGSFSGKDPTKVDRSAAYAARWVAKNIVAAGLARRCQVQLAYAIGVANPVSVNVTTFGTGTVSDDVLQKAVTQVFDLRPAAIIRDLDLRRPIYRQLAAYGHMGRDDLDVAWEKTDKAATLKAAIPEPKEALVPTDPAKKRPWWKFWARWSKRNKAEKAKAAAEEPIAAPAASETPADHAPVPEASAAPETQEAAPQDNAEVTEA